MAVTVSIINLKGGVGKSTLTMLLGEFLAFRHAKNVLLVDMDSQANLSYCMVPSADIQTQYMNGRTAYHLLRAGFERDDPNIADYITDPPLRVSNVSRGWIRSYGIHLDMVVSTPAVAQLDEDLMSLWEQGRQMPREIRQTLARALEPVWTRYDYILIDCPPGLSLFSSTALIASDYYISPIIPEPLSLQGVQLVQDRQAQLRERYDARAQFAGVILNIVKHYRKTHHRIAEDIYVNHNLQYAPFDYWLPDNDRLRALGEYDPELQGPWAMGVDGKFPTLQQKYALTYQLANPSDGSLNRQGAEGRSYRLYDRISNLVDEFIEKCPS